MSHYKNEYRELSFSRGGYGSLCLLSGWNNCESWGVKSSSLNCSLILPEIKSCGDDVDLNIVCKIVSKCDIYFNDILVSSNCVTDNTTHSILKVTLSNDNFLVKNIIKFDLKRANGLELVSIFLDDSSCFIKKPLLYNNVLSKRFNINPNDESDPIFIVGVPRSGTSILFRILGRLFKQSKHPLLEPFVFSYIFEGLNNEFYKECALSFLGSDNNYVHYFNEIANLKEKRIDIDLARALINVYYSLAKKYHNVDYLIDKTPDNIFYYSAIFDIFPNAKIIFCHRSAVDVYASIKKRLSDDSDSKESVDSQWLKMNCEEFSKFYLNYIDAYKKCFTHHRNSIFLLEYNEFISRDPVLLSKLANFIGVDESELMKSLDAGSLVNTTYNGLLNDSLIFNQTDYNSFLSKDEIIFLESFKNMIVSK